LFRVFLFAFFGAGSFFRVVLAAFSIVVKISDIVQPKAPGGYLIGLAVLIGFELVVEWIRVPKEGRPRVVALGVLAIWTTGTAVLVDVILPAIQDVTDLTARAFVYGPSHLICTTLGLILLASVPEEHVPVLRKDESSDEIDELKNWESSDEDS
jgi:hypothetical protein